MKPNCIKKIKIEQRQTYSPMFLITNLTEMIFSNKRQSALQITKVYCGKMASTMTTLVMAIVFIFSAHAHLSANNTYECSYENTEDTAMFKTAKEVLDNLKNAKGILPSEAPRLKMYKFRGSGKLASMHLKKGEIHLDIETFKLCQEMGSDSLNGLAFLLGHELGHFIHAHGGVNHNIEDEGGNNAMRFAAVRAVNEEFNATREFEKRMSDALFQYRETHDEAEADFEGAFLGYLAGYDTREAGKTFLRRAYQKFGISSSQGYPSLEERLIIIDKTTADLSKVTPIFELAKYLVSIGQYADAIPLLEQISTKFESPEIYNNLAVSQVLQILSVF